MTAPSVYYPAPRAGFPAGIAGITGPDDPMEGAGFKLGINFGIHRTAPGDTVSERSACETAWVLLQGSAELACGEIRAVVERHSIFDGMYYLWMIRHLPGNPYTGFIFAEEHEWTLDPARQGWRPSGLPAGLA